MIGTTLWNSYRLEQGCCCQKISEEEEIKLTFYTWLIKNYKGANNPKGDLAEDARTDRRFPKSAKTHKRISEYLNACGACWGCIEAFEEAYKEYERTEAKKSVGKGTGEKACKKD